MWSTLMQLWGAGLILCRLGRASMLLRSHWDLMLDFKKIFGEDDETFALAREWAGMVVTIVAALLGGYYLMRALATKWVAFVITGVLAIVAALWVGNYVLRGLFPLVLALYSELSYETFATIFVRIFVTLVWTAYWLKLRISKGLEYDDILIIGILEVLCYCLLKGLFALLVAVHLYTGLSSDTVFKLVAAIFWALDFTEGFWLNAFSDIFSTGKCKTSERYLRELLSFIAVLVAGYYLSSVLAALLVAIHLQSGYSGIFVTVVVAVMMSCYFLSHVELFFDLVWTKRVFVSGTMAAALYLLWRGLFVVVVAVHVYSRLPSKILFVAVGVFLAEAFYLPLVEDRYKAI